jgi:Uma2 family endonuclease
MEREHLHVSDEQIIAANVTWDDYMANYAADVAEWVDGAVISLKPVRLRHNDLAIFVMCLLHDFLSRAGGGHVLHSSFVMKLSKSSREPDVQVVLPASLERIKDTYLDGPADLVVEIISPESDTRDRMDKFSEYQAGGVPEYWIIDPIYEEALFYQRDEQGLFRRAPLDENGVYHSKVLPRLALSPSVFWQQNLPDGAETARLVEAMLVQQP